MKACNRCKTKKAFSSFSKNSREDDLLCRECNSSKGNKLLTEWQKTIRVRGD